MDPPLSLTEKTHDVTSTQWHRDRPTDMGEFGAWRYQLPRPIPKIRHMTLIWKLCRVAYIIDGCDRQCITLQLSLSLLYIKYSLLYIACCEQHRLPLRLAVSEQQKALACSLLLVIYRVGQKRGHRLMTVILSNLNRFTKFFHWEIPE